MHDVKRGAADRSYGVQVAQLAGLPPSVVSRARSVLEMLEKNERDGGETKALIDDLPLFAATPAPAPAAPKSSPVTDRLEAINPDDMSPREALEALYELKQLSLK